MRARIVIAISALAILVGCGSTDSSTPVACLGGAGPYLVALKSAPGAVELKGETPISDCLVENQPGGDLANVGTAMVAAATKLNAGARAKPGGAADVELGY